MTTAQRMAGFGRNTFYQDLKPEPRTEWKSAWRLDFERRSAQDAQSSVPVKGKHVDQVQAREDSYLPQPGSRSGRGQR
jgi:hypothetical protein